MEDPFWVASAVAMEAMVWVAATEVTVAMVWAAMVATMARDISKALAISRRRAATRLAV